MDNQQLKYSKNANIDIYQKRLQRIHNSKLEEMIFEKGRSYCNTNGTYEKPLILFGDQDHKCGNLKEKITCFGVLILGSTYFEGNFINGERCGRGFYISKGFSYIGEFKDSFIHGDGELYYNYEIIEKGTFHKGKFIKTSEKN